MPELPEVETSRRGISPYVMGERVDNFVIRERPFMGSATTRRSVTEL